MTRSIGYLQYSTYSQTLKGQKKNITLLNVFEHYLEQVMTLIE